jgi:hypothetical protein
VSSLLIYCEVYFDISRRLKYVDRDVMCDVSFDVDTVELSNSNQWVVGWWDEERDTPSPTSTQHTQDITHTPYNYNYNYLQLNVQIERTYVPRE